MTNQMFPIYRPALIIVDMQNDFVRAGAPLEVPEGRQIISRIQSLADVFRKSSCPVIYLRWITVPNDPYLRFNGKWDWIELVDEPTLACREGHRRLYSDTSELLNCWDVIPELEPSNEDIIINKHGFGGFTGTNLHQQLLTLQVNTIFVTGVVAEGCVEDTCREAFSHIYKVVLIVDAIGSNNPMEKQTTIKSIYNRYGWITTTEAAISVIRPNNTDLLL